MQLKSLKPLIAVFGTSLLITITLIKSFQVFMGISICLLAMLKLMDIEAFGISFKKYDFSGYDILIVEGVKEFSDNLIREIQKFMLSKKTMFYFLDDTNNEYLSKTLDYPKIKALRGTSKNQFFKFDEEYPIKYLSVNSKEFQIFRFYEMKDYNNDEAYFNISTNDPLVIKKNILGSKVIFLATKIDKELTNELFREFVYDLFIDLVHNQIVVNES